MTKKVIAVMLSVLLLLSSMTALVGAVSLTGAEFTQMLDNVDAFMSAKTPAQRQTIYDFLEVYTSTDAGMDTLVGLVDDQSEVSQLVSEYIQSYGVSDTEKQTLKMLLTLMKCIPESIRRTAAEDLHDFVAFTDYDTSATYAEGTEALRTYLFDGSAAEADGLTDAVFYQLAYNLRDLVVFTADENDPAFNYEFYAFTNTELKDNIENILIPEFAELNGTQIVSAEHFMGLFCDVINADVNVTADMKRKVAETLVTINSFVYGSEATGLSIATTDPISQMMGLLSNVTFDLTATKADDTKEGYVPAVKWYVNDELVQYTGESYVFVPSAAGTYAVKAVCGDVSSNVINVIVRASSTTVVVPTPDQGESGSSSSGSNSGISSGANTGASSSEGTIPAPKPNMYPTIPAPDKVGFVTLNGSTNAISSQKTTFDDVKNHWSQDYVEVLATAGLLRGHSKSDYKPDLGVTREEMAVILARMLGVEGQKAKSMDAFSDHSDIQDFAVDAVYKMVEMGIYKGYGEGHFAPQQILTREEITALFSRIMGKASLQLNKTFDDHHEIAEWFVEDVENLVNYGIISGYPDDTFRAKNDVTRAEAAVMMYNTLYRMGIIK